jgi:hypothetical protein
VYEQYLKTPPSLTELGLVLINFLTSQEETCYKIFNNLGEMIAFQKTDPNIDFKYVQSDIVNATKEIVLNGAGSLVRSPLLTSRNNPCTTLTRARL